MVYLTTKEKENHHKLTLKILILGLILSAIIANSVIVFSDPHKKHSTAIWILNITAAVASSLAIIAVCRHGVHGLHGKSYLFLTLGLISWFSAELTLLYYYYALHIEEQRLISLTDGFWFAGYLFLALHLLTVLRSLRGTIKPRVVVIVSIVTVLFVIYNVFNLASSEFLVDVDFAAFIVTVAYPILDLMLIIPSAIILVSLRRDYQHSVPWFLSSLSLLVNAVADDGYVNDFVNANSQNLWTWDLFYVTDFIIMAGALFWYNKFHISNEIRKARLQQ
ncbi:MAG: hypothetical protein M3M84_05845 [Thermoproteota archaeon]|nr:hypothetical protein [Thermoproteota archaeon]